MEIKPEKKPKSNKKPQKLKTKLLTHLFQNNKCCETISTNLQLSSLSVLYYHNNLITKIEHLQTATNLKMLYLQRNKIDKIQNLECLVNLEKLYLGYNKISVVEGLEKLRNLRELHLERQDLDGDSLCFDGRSICSIASSLEVLVISHNNISTITSLIPLKYITHLDASHNNLCDIRDICDAVYNWYYIQELKLIGNPIAKQRQYRENVILSSHKLFLLDNKEISDMTRSFMKRFEQEKLKNASRASINIPDWAKEYGPPALQKAVYAALVTKPSFDNNNTTIESNVNDIYLPWKALPTSKNKVGKFTMPSQK